MQSSMIQQEVENVAPLAANATGEGGAYDTNPTDTQSGSEFRAMVYADQAGTLNIQQSRDGNTWRTAASTAIAANTAVILECKIVRQYVRAQVVNGATAQTVLELDTAIVWAD